MNKTLTMSVSPLTNISYAGTPLKDGKTWSSDKQDVTLEAFGRIEEDKK